MERVSGRRLNRASLIQPAHSAAGETEAWSGQRFVDLGPLPLVLQDRKLGGLHRDLSPDPAQLRLRLWAVLRGLNFPEWKL